MSKTKKIIIIGGIGNAVNIAEQIEDARINYGFKDEFLGFAFDDESFGSEINGFPLLSKSREVYDKYKKFNDVYFIYQMYRPDKIKERANWLPEFKVPLERFCNFIHPSSMVCRSVKMGLGNVVHANCVINANSTIGNHNTFNSTSHFSHNSNIGNHNFFAAQCVVGAGTFIKNYVFIGLNATVNGAIEIEENVIIGMGSVVTKSIETPNQVVYGVPARKVKDI